MSETFSRRNVLVGEIARREHYVSSAVVVALPQRIEALAAELDAIEGVEVHGGNDSRLVVVLEGSTSGELGSLLTTISLMDGVISANMVFEQAEEFTGDDIGDNPA